MIGDEVKEVNVVIASLEVGDNTPLIAKLMSLTSITPITSNRKLIIFLREAEMPHAFNAYKDKN